MTTTINNEVLAAVIARAREQAAQTPAGRKGKTPRACACGCGRMTRGGKWFPGHDGIVTGVVIRATREGKDVAEALAASAAALALK